MNRKKPDSEEDREFRKQIIGEVSELIMQKGKEIQDSDMPTTEQLAKVDVLLDTVHFLSDYDENVKVLNKYWLEKKWKQKFGRLPKKGNERDD